MLVIHEPRYRTGFLMRDIVRYNSSNHRDKRLRVIPSNLNEVTLLLVSSFKDAYTALEYLKTTNDNEELFKSIGEIPYESYIISNENLNQLKATNNLEAWKKFYQLNYVYRRPPAPKTEEAAETEPVKEEQKAQNEVQAETVTQQEQEKTEITEASSEPEITLTNQENSEQKQETSVDTTTEASATADENSSNETSPYVFDPEEMHNLIYILPQSGSNQTLLITYLSRLNAMKYRGNAIEINKVQLDDYRSMVIISGIGNAERAKNYLNTVNSDNRVSMSLKNVNYKSFLISNQNLETFKQSKDIAEYQKFYTIHY